MPAAAAPLNVAAPAVPATAIATEAPAGQDVDALQREVARRRTFAIISHPDAGKTTLTEKLLLYSGAVDLAGAVRGRKTQRHATSDWMAMEQERGISITSTALQFDHGGICFNLLDTPGHQDFSEDTYRTLTAVDSAIMVLDSAKGIEPQTRKLFEVCRQRQLPILTFINKMDRPGREPLELLDEIERVLGLGVVPMNWPIGTGLTFEGVYDRERQQVLRFERTERNERRAPAFAADLNDPELATLLGEAAYRRLREDVELLTLAGETFDRGRFLAGEVTPVYFGSALNNFGVEPFLQALAELAPEPAARMSDRGLVPPAQASFTGFIFKIQANMDPRHRDCMAFLRVCSGRFEKDMLVHHARLGRKIRMARPHRLFAQARETAEEAYPGDVVGLVNPGLFVIGDTLSSGAPIQFDAVPRFAPEVFGLLRNQDVSRYKQFHKGLRQLEEEGAIQVFLPEGAVRLEPILAAVGELQFDVVVARLRAEYGVETAVDRLAATCVRWVEGSPDAIQALFRSAGSGIRQARDRDGRLVALFASEWEIGYCQRQNPDVLLKELA
jgi:peptide chain release factor 3